MGGLPASQERLCSFELDQLVKPGPKPFYTRALTRRVAEKNSLSFSFASQMVLRQQKAQASFIMWNPLPPMAFRQEGNALLPRFESS
jgi:hypothetical protein